MIVASDIVEVNSNSSILKKVNNFRKGKKSVQFWVYEPVKELMDGYENAILLKHTNFSTRSAILRSFFTKLTYFLAIKEDEFHKIPEIDRNKIEFKALLNKEKSDKDLISNLIQLIKNHKDNELVPEILKIIKVHESKKIYAEFFPFLEGLG